MSEKVGNVLIVRKVENDGNVRNVEKFVGNCKILKCPKSQACKKIASNLGIIWNVGYMWNIGNLGNVKNFSKILNAVNDENNGYVRNFRYFDNLEMSSM